MDEERQVVMGGVKSGASSPKIEAGSRSEVVSTDAAEIYVDSELEKRVMGKFDRFILPQFAILVLIAYLNRSNIGMYHINSFKDESLTLPQATPKSSV
jgi:hypothetical protein